MAACTSRRGDALPKHRHAVPARLRAGGRNPALRRQQPAYSGTVSPEPPNSAGKSFSFGKPSRIGSTVSA